MIKTKVATNAANPTETPEEKAAREAEQARAEAAQIDETQGFLRLDTLRRSRRYGLLGGKNAFGGSSSGALRIGAAPRTPGAVSNLTGSNPSPSTAPTGKNLSKTYAIAE